MMPRKSSALVASRTTLRLTPNRAIISCSVRSAVPRFEAFLGDVLAELGRQLLAQSLAVEFGLRDRPHRHPRSRLQTVLTTIVSLSYDTIIVAALQGGGSRQRPEQPLETRIRAETQPAPRCLRIDHIPPIMGTTRAVGDGRPA